MGRVALRREVQSGVSDLPTGTVTFLFTDIEGSTRLVQELGEEWAELVARHDEILRAAIASGGGTEVRTEGDAFFAVFATAAGAVNAVVGAQRAFAGEPWPEGHAIRVRMGLHTGSGILGGGDYVGLDVHRAARIAAAGSGGQVLVSEATRVLAEPDLEEGVGLGDLGAHRLKDLVRPEHLFQLEIAGLPTDFAALRTLDARPNNLPIQLTSFVGRDRDLFELGRLLGTSRLVTLTGAGGSGKTRLALEFAGHEFDSYPDGVWFVDLAAVDDPVVIAATVASTLGVSDRAGQKILDWLVDRLSVEQTLLILDNCEHLVAAAASVASELVNRTDALVVLATSREPLGITGEHPYPVPTLDSPEAGNGDYESSSESPAVRLFVDRASVARPGIQLSQDDAEVVAAICRRLDGLPLALELAAARLSILTPSELLERLDDRFAVLVGGARDRLPRQQTLAATIDWSYQLLTDEEKLLFGRLSVFSGGFTLDAAEAICAGDDVASDRILDLVSGLVDKSLLVAEQGRAGGRFRLLETMREYAAAKLPTTEGDERRQAHADFFRRLVVDSFGELWGPGEVGWLDRLEDEWPNIRRALAWHLDTAQTQDGLLMAGSLYRFAFRRHYNPEVLAWLERFIDADTTPGSARARALLGIGTLSQLRHYFEEASPYLGEAIAFYREFGPTDELAAALHNAANSAKATGDWESAHTMIAEAVEVRSGTEDRAGLALDLRLQAEIALEAGHHPGQAVELAEKSLDLAQRSKSPEAILQALQGLGDLRRHAGDLDGAEAALHEALKVETDMPGRHVRIGYTEFLLSEVALAKGDVGQAVLHLAENATLVRRLFEEDDTQLIFVAWPLHLWAEAAVQQQIYAVAVALLGAQTALYQALASALRPTEQTEAENTMSKARASLDPESFEQAWEEGMAMSGPEALDHAVDQLGPGVQPPR